MDPDLHLSTRSRIQITDTTLKKPGSRSDKNLDPPDQVLRENMDPSGCGSETLLNMLYVFMREQPYLILIIVLFLITGSLVVVHGSLNVLISSQDILPGSLQDVFPSSQDVMPGSLKDVFPSSLDDIFPSSQDVLPSSLTDVFPSSLDNAFPSSLDFLTGRLVVLVP